MITRLIFGIALLFAAPVAPVSAQTVGAPPPDAGTEFAPLDGSSATLEQFLWTARPIVVFADSPADPRFVEQMRFLSSDVPGLLARDVVVLFDTDPKSRSDLRQTLRPRGFMLVLIDKDGQVKLRKPAPWTVREITRSIDKWPTRQQEIREELGKE